MYFKSKVFSLHSYKGTICMYKVSLMNFRPADVLKPFNTQPPPFASPRDRMLATIEIPNQSDFDFACKTSVRVNINANIKYSTMPIYWLHPRAAMLQANKVRLAIRSRIALPLHSAFTLPLRAHAANGRINSGSSLWTLRISKSRASRHHFPKQSGLKINAKVNNINELALYKYCTSILHFAGKIKITLIWNFPQ